LWKIGGLDDGLKIRKLKYNTGMKRAGRCPRETFRLEAGRRVSSLYFLLKTFSIVMMRTIAISLTFFVLSDQNTLLT
jgi:hypothetical protein